MNVFIDLGMGKDFVYSHKCLGSTSHLFLMPGVHVIAADNTCAFNIPSCWALYYINSRMSKAGFIPTSRRPCKERGRAREYVVVVVMSVEGETLGSRNRPSAAGVCLGSLFKMRPAYQPQPCSCCDHLFYRCTHTLPTAQHSKELHPAYIQHYVEAKDH